MKRREFSAALGATGATAGTGPLPAAEADELHHLVSLSFDDEGWGPISPGYLERLLGRLRSIDAGRILATARTLVQALAGANPIQPAKPAK